MFRLFWQRFALLRYVLTYRPMAGAETPPDDPPPDDKPDDKPPPPATPPTTPPAKSFNEEQVERIVQERLARQKTQFKDYDELKTQAQELKELKESQQSDTEKLLARAEAAEQAANEAVQRADSASQERDAATQRAKETLRRAAVVSAAASKAINPQEVYALIAAEDFRIAAKDNEGHEQTYEVVINDDGQVEGAGDAVEAFLAARPHLVGARPPEPGPGDGGTATAPTPGTGLESETDSRKVRELAKQYSRR